MIPISRPYFGDEERLAVEAALASGWVAQGPRVQEFERAYLCNLMAATHGNVSAAGRLAGKERRTLARLLKKHGIDRGRFLPERR